jgi:hypothetical protein
MVNQSTLLTQSISCVNKPLKLWSFNNKKSEQKLAKGWGGGWCQDNNSIMMKDTLS